MTAEDRDYAEALRRIEAAKGTSSLDLSLLTALERIPEEIKDLTELRSLDLFKCFNITSLEPLAALLALEELDLGWCAVRSLEPLSGLRALKALHLNFCMDLVSLVPLSKLRALTSLNITGCGSISSLAPIAGSKRLKLLDMRKCEAVTSLDPLAAIKGLCILRISRCNSIISLDPLVHLEKISELHAQGLNKGHLVFPEHLAKGNCKLLLGESVFANLSDELIGGVEEKDIGPILVRHFAELEQGTAELREVKLVLVGNGRSGKSSLVRALMGRIHETAEKSTHGIRHWHWRPSVVLKGDEQRGPQPVDVNLWDFGGQQIYHELHRLFMRTRAVFVLLWNPWEEEWKLDVENPDDPAEFKEDEYHPLDYWLDQIHAHSTLRKPQIILVRNFMDKDQPYSKRYGRCAPSGWKEMVSSRYRDAENIQYVECSAADRDSPMGRKRLGELRLAVEFALNEQMRQLMCRYIPQGRYALRQHIAALAKEGPDGEEVPSNVRTLDLSDFDALVARYCTVNGVHDTPKILRFFNDIGVLYYNERMRQKVVLDQRWAIEAFYTILAYGASRDEVIRAGGRFTRSFLVRWGWKRYAKAEQLALLEMMERCGVAVPIRSAHRSAKGQGQYLAPSLLNTWKDPLVRKLAAEFPRNGTGLRARVKHAQLGSEVLLAVLAEVAQRFGDEGVYWRYGFRLRTGDGVHAHVEWSALEKHTYGGQLVVEVVGSSRSEPSGLYSTLRELFLRRTPIINAHTWVEEHLKGRHPEPPEPPLAVADAWSQEQFQRITPAIAYRERLSVGLSYAGKGNSPKVVNALSAVLKPALADLGIDLIDYRNLESEALDDSRRVINAVANSHLVLVFRDDNYLRSINCLCELVGAYEAEPKGTFKRDRVKVIQLSAARYFTNDELEGWVRAADAWWRSIRDLLGGNAARDSTVTKVAMEKREYIWYDLADDRRNLVRFNEFIRNHNTHVVPPMSLEPATLMSWADALAMEVVQVMKERWIKKDGRR